MICFLLKEITKSSHIFAKEINIDTAKAIQAISFLWIIVIAEGRIVCCFKTSKKDILFEVAILLKPNKQNFLLKHEAYN